MGGVHRKMMMKEDSGSGKRLPVIAVQPRSGGMAPTRRR